MGLSVCNEWSFRLIWFSVKSLETKVWTLFSFKEVVFILWFCLFFLLYSFTFFWFFGYRYKKFILVSCWLNTFVTFFVGSFEVCYSFFGFVYVYCLVHQSAVVFCFVFCHKSAAQFFLFVNSVMFMSVFCSFIEVVFSFFCICQF